MFIHRGTRSSVYLPPRISTGTEAARAVVEQQLLRRSVLLFRRFRMVWAGDRNYFTIGDAAYPEDHTVLEYKADLVYNRCDESCWHSGGDHMLLVFVICPRTHS